MAPLSVYYVNCDVDGPPTEKAALAFIGNGSVGTGAEGGSARR